MLHHQNNPECYLGSITAKFPELNFPSSSKCDLQILSTYNKIKYGLFNSWQYQCRLKTDLARTHILTGFNLQETDQVSSSYITSGDLDAVENRYLLAGKSSGGMAIFDIVRVRNGMKATQVGRIKGGVRGTHNKAVTCAQWYPVDAGLFTTSSSESCVKIWDPNTMKKVDEFRIDCRANHHHMSPVASKHSLVAIAGEKGNIILCDLRTGSSSHQLHGHEGPVKVVQWTRHDPNCLASGGKDKTIRIWDTRSGKSCLRVLDSDNINEETFKHRKRMKKTHEAHSGQISSLCFTHDGLWLVSFSYDGRIKVWNTTNGRNMNVKFGSTYTDIKRSLSMSVSYNLYPDFIYIPSKSNILVYELLTGKKVNVLTGHFSTVFGTIYNPTSGDLYSYGTDENFLIWTPKHFYPKENDEGELDCYPHSTNIRLPTADSWSSDEG